jgi:PAS domain S-box-containing protein
MKVRVKLIIGFSAIVICLWLIVTYAGNNYGNLKQQFTAVEEDIIPNTMDLTEVEKTAYDAYRQSVDYILFDMTEAKQNAIYNINHLNDIRKKYQSYGEGIEDEEYIVHQELISKINMLTLGLITVMNIKEMGASRDELLAQDRNTSLPALLDLEHFINEQKAANIEELAVVKTDFQQAYIHGINWLLISAGLITLIAVAASFLTTRSITRPLHALHKGTEIIAKGNLDYKVGTKAHDEIGQLSRAFDQMTLNLTSSMTSIDNLNQEIAERKRAEEALRESEAKYSSLVERGNDGIIILQDGVIKYANSKMVQMVGYTVEETMNKPFINYVSPEHREFVIDRYRKRTAGEEVPVRYEFDIIAKDGKAVNVEVNASLLEYKGTIADMAIIRDVTERKRAEEALRESEEKFSKGFYSSPDIMSIVNLENNKFIEANDSFTRYTGYTRDEVIGHTSIELGIWANPEERDRIVRTLHDQGRVSNEEIHTRNKSGEIHIGIFSAETIHIGGELYSITVIVDITERKRAEEALRESEEKLRLMYESATEGIIIADLNGIIIDANEAAVRMNGCDSKKQLIGRSAFEFIAEKDHARATENLKKTLEQGRGGIIEYTILREDGSEFPGELSAAIIRDKSGNPTRFVAIIRDITERKRAEEALRESEEKFHKAFRSTPDAIAITTLKDGRFIEVNDSYTRITGFTREEVIGHTTSELGHWKKPGMRDRIIKTLMKRGRISNEEVHLSLKSGGLSTSLFSAELIHVGGEPCMISVTTDITERKKREQLQQDENYVLTLIGQGAELSELLDAIVRLGEKHDTSIKGSVLLYDSSRDRLFQASGPSLPDDFKEPLKEGLPIGPNIGACGTAAYKKQRVIVADIKNSPLFKPFKEVIKQSINNGLLSCWSEPIISSNGELLGTIANYSNRVGEPSADSLSVLEWSAKVAAIAIERKQAETELRTNEERFRLIADNATDMISRIQMSPTTRTDYVSPSCFNITGYKQEEFYTDPNLGMEIVHPEDRELLQKSAVLDKKNPHKTITIRLRRKDGKVIWIEQTHTIISNEHGEAAAMHVIARDITARKEAEEALRLSEQKFSKAFRSSPNTIAITTLKDGKYIEVNDSFTHITGYTRDEVIGRNSKSIAMWAKAEDRERMLKMLKEKGQIYNEEFDFRIKSGEIRTWLFSAELIDIGDELCIISMTIDITELKRAQAALKESEEFSTSLMKSTAVPLLVVNKDTSMRYVNPALEKLTGFTSEEIIGKMAPYPWWIKEEKASGNVSEIKSDMQTGIRRLEKLFKNRNREQFWVEVSSVPINSNGKFQYSLENWLDITERKRAQAALSESEEKFSKAFSSSPDIISIINTISNTFIEVNDNFCNFTGYSRDEVIGHTPTELGIWANPEERDRILNIMNKEGRASNEEFHLRTKSGEIRLALLSSEQILIGGESCSIAVVIDITESKAAEEKLKQTLAELKSSSAQLAATNKELEAFSYSVSHDLRSPLRSIDGFSQALLEDYENKLDKNGKDYLQRLRGASQKMGELIDGILKLSRLTRSEMHKEKINLSALAEEITARLQEDQPERDADFVISKGLIDRGDPQLLRALFENLLGNAWKFTSKREKTRIEFGITKNGGEKTYFINDNGAGFDMTYADKLFGAFQRLHEVSEFPGTGIGLATVQRIINRHGGSIWAEGVVEKGATFYFTLN